MQGEAGAKDYAILQLNDLSRGNATVKEELERLVENQSIARFWAHEFIGQLNNLVNDRKIHGDVVMGKSTTLSLL